MPVFDFIAFGRAFIRYGLAISLFLYLAGIASMLGDGIMALWSIVSNSVDALNSHLSGGGESNQASSCAYYMLNALGVSTSLGSFFLTLTGLGVAWGTFVSHITLARFTYVIKNKLIESVK